MIALIFHAVTVASVVIVTLIIFAVVIFAVSIFADIIVSVILAVSVIVVVFSDAAQLECALIVFFCDLEFHKIHIHAQMAFYKNLSYTDIARLARFLGLRENSEILLDITCKFYFITSINDDAFYCIAFCIE